MEGDGCMSKVAGVSKVGTMLFDFRLFNNVKDVWHDVWRLARRKRMMVWYFVMLFPFVNNWQLSIWYRR